MASTTVKRYTCDVCGRAKEDVEMRDDDSADFPNGWARLSYRFVDYKSSTYISKHIDICECCLVRDTTKITFRPSEMIKEGNHAPD